MERAEESVGVAEGIEEAVGLAQGWARAKSSDIAAVLVQCWAEAFLGAEEDLCGGGSERLENHTIRTESS